VLAVETFPSASRTIAAAPFAYVLVAAGIVAIAGLASRIAGRAAGTAIAVTLLAAVVAINLHRYFVVYADGLPYQNTPIARRITDFVDRLAPGTAVYLVGSGWAPAPAWMPEPKSIRYTLRDPTALHEVRPERVDCAFLASIERPAVLIWSYHSTLPSPGVADCANDLAPRLSSSEQGLPLFHSSSLAEPADARP
jgi:hypothetical protein